MTGALMKRRGRWRDVLGRWDQAARLRNTVGPARQARDSGTRPSLGCHINDSDYQGSNKCSLNKLISLFLGAFSRSDVLKSCDQSSCTFLGVVEVEDYVLKSIKHSFDSCSTAGCASGTTSFHDPRSDFLLHIGRTHTVASQ
jgi:hypothetical protein